MKFKWDDGTISIDLYDLLDEVTGEQAQRMAKSLSCLPVVVQGVIEQLCEGFTEDGFWSDDATLQAARMKVMERMDEVMFRTAKTLLHQRDHAKESEERTREWAWGMYHAWPRESTGLRPRQPDFVGTHVSDDEVREAIKATQEGGDE